MTEKDSAKDNTDLAGQWSDHFDVSIKSETTRAKVVLSACYIEELLAQLLLILLVPCKDRTDPLFEGAAAPLGTFSAKIEVAARLGVVPDEIKASLHLIRKIRNYFAHRITDCSFEEDRIRNWNLELHKLNDHATPERRATFSPGAVGDFEKSASWLIYWLKHRIEQIPTACPHCGSEMEHRNKIRMSLPDTNHR